MRRVLKAVGLSLLTVVVVVALAVYAISERILRRKYPAAAPPIAFTATPDSASISEGERLARLRGCTGCHGAQAQGRYFVDNWFLARVAAPDLTRAVREYSDPQLALIIRHGVRSDGRSMVVMPSAMFTPLTDEDLGRIITYLRSLPPQNGLGRGVRFGPIARVMFALGKFKPAAEEVRESRELDSTFPAASDSNGTGAYLARTVCTECHGPDLRGDPGGRPPDLRIAAAYSADAFAHLMRAGKAPGERELPLMSSVARNRFSRFTDAEIAALHRYLIARAASRS